TQPMAARRRLAARSFVVEPEACAASCEGGRRPQDPRRRRRQRPCPGVDPVELDFFGLRRLVAASQSRIRISNSPVIVIARPAKQSIPRHKERMDCFVAFAPRNDDRHTRPHSPGANAPELCKQFVAPKKTEGAGKAGCSMHPQPRTQTKKRASVVATGSPKHSDLPCAMVYGLFRLSPVTGLFCHCRFAGIASRET